MSIVGNFVRPRLRLRALHLDPSFGHRKPAGTKKANGRLTSATQ